MVDAGAVRAAETLLRTCGRSVLLRLPGAAVTGAAGEELGLATPVFNDAVLEPCAFAGGTLLVAASAVTALVGSLAFDSADVLFATAAGVVVDGVVWRVTEAAAMPVGDAVVAWRVGLTA